MKNFFQNSPYDEKSKKESLKNGLFSAAKKNSTETFQSESSSFMPIFDANFFNEKPIEAKEEKKIPSKIVQKRLNDFDGNILQESALLNFDDKDIRLEEKIKIAKELLMSYKEKISLVEMIGDSPVKNKLIAQKEDLEGILTNLNSELKSTGGFGKNLSSVINDEKRIIKEKINGIKNICRKKIRPYDFLYKYFPRIYQIKILKDSLKKLREINKLIGELTQSQTPYGEGDMKYQSMIAYLSSASTLHSKLKKQIGN